MNVIFLDFDGVLTTIHASSNSDIERRIILLSKICKLYDASIVVEASAKDAIDENTLETNSEYVGFILDTFKKYGINYIGRTPNVEKTNGVSIIPIWKEDEIIEYLNLHPEIKHFCVIDDDDLGPLKSDLNKVRNHLVTPIYYSSNPSEEGLLEKHITEIGNALKLDNEFLFKRNH